MSNSQVPEVSVIIPTYNRANELAQCLDSLVEQTFKDFEVIVSDDGSTDNTTQIVAEYSKRLVIKYIYSENFGGPARPRNLALQNATGKYIAFLDADDTWLPNKLEVCIKKLEEGFDLVHHGFYKTGPFINKFIPSSIKCRELTQPVYFDLILNGNQIINSSVLVKKSIIDVVGPICEDKDLIAAEDFDYWLRISQVTNAFGFIPKELGYYKVSESGISKNPKQAIKYINSLYARHISKLLVKNQIEEPVWALLTSASANMALKNYAEAKFSLQKLLRRKLSLTTRIKIVYLLLQTALFTPTLNRADLKA